MTVTSENNKRIAKNTMLLYVRMLFTMGVSLYTSRVVLNTLGVEDFGIYNVVGGVVAMFTIVSGSLSASVSRFITFELGKGNIEKLKRVFSTSVTVHISLAIIIFILAELLGVWFLNAKMNIPANRMSAANWVLQCSILTFMINLISVPYNASIIAHERMKAFSYISILDVTLKLGVVFLLLISSLDKLAFYAAMLLLVSIIVRMIYGIYCKRQFKECTYHFIYDKPLLKEMTGFAGWNFIGSSSGILRDQGVNILLNLFCGATVNAARGIAVQVSNAVSGFTSNFMMALNPQITKSYASGDRTYMMTLIQQGARLSFYLLLFLSLPVLIETEFILRLWLKMVPVHAVNFVRLILILAMCESLSGTLITAMLATGRIRNYQIIVGGMQLMNFPVSYILLKLGFIPESTMIAAIVISFCALFIRLQLLRSMVGLSTRYYLQHVLFNVWAVLILSGTLPYVCFITMESGILRFFTVCIVCMISVLSVIYLVGCSSKDKQFIRQKIQTNLYSKFRK